MVRTQIQLSDEQAVRIKKIAAARHLSMAEVIRQAVDAAIKTTLVDDIGERKQRAVAVVGKFSSGRRDISQQHDAYLAEAFSK